MAFPDWVKNQAIGRQDGKCGDCGEDLEEVIFHAHHLLRQADGGDDSLDNCVMLCEECHYAAHNYGNYRQPIQLSPSDFPYFYG
jgi:5-methylcytosine-specific restriction endonuclease McrA